MLRAIETGISINELDLLTVGMVLDIFSEKISDINNEPEVKTATQEDMDAF